MKLRWRTRRFRRFLLAILLFVTACLAGGLAGYRVGHRQGMQSTGPVLVLYDVSGLIPAKSARNGTTIDTMDELLTLLKSEAALDDWSDESVPAMIKPMPDGNKLIIHANAYTHEVVSDLLSDFQPDVARRRRGEVEVGANGPTEP